MRVLITGKSGQLGNELQGLTPAGLTVKSCDRSELDITSADMTREVITAFRPDVVINTAAYTRVDLAETEQQQAFLVNRDGVSNLVENMAPGKTRLVHISTDFVFPGTHSRPYAPDTQVEPLGAYGRSKAAGEQVILERHADRSVIIRTSWLYSVHGNNFVKTMLSLMANRESVNVVADQVGSPTWARGLAETVWTLATRDEINGIFHWSDAGVASWYDFAYAIQDEAIRIGLLKNRIPINPISTAEYPTPARRPEFSVLDNSDTWDIIGRKSDNWRYSLSRMLIELKGR